MEVEREYLMQGIFVLVGFGVLAAAMAAFVSARLMKTLESRHPEVWQRLGAPKSVVMSPSENRVLRKFFRSKEYLKLGDADVNSYGRSIRTLSFLATVSFCSGAVLIVFVAVAVRS